MPSIESLKTKFRNNIFIPLTYRHRRGKLVNKDITIISNNCWGGTVYEAYGLQKQSPTVGLFFMAGDYIKFISNLKEYLDGELLFIKPENSRWRMASQISGDKRFGSYPIGVLSKAGIERESIEIFFLHYHSEEEAKDKWIRRCRRVNWNRLLIKFNDQNGCMENDIEEFCSLPYENKLFFTVRKWHDEKKYKKSIGGGVLLYKAKV